MRIIVLTAVTLLSLLCIAIGLPPLWHAADGLRVTQTQAGDTPITLYESHARPGGPVVVIAHGFAGSQQLMQAFALTLARQGYRVATFDFPGHGRNQAPLPGSLTDYPGMARGLQDALAGAVDFARSQGPGDARVALLGHSMASEIVVRYALEHPQTTASVGVSLYASGVSATSPRNLLVIDGALEPAALRAEGLRIVGMAANGEAQPDRTYGNFADGSARRLIIAPGVEHIGVLYSSAAIGAASAWLDQSFGRSATGRIEQRGASLAWLYLGLLLLAWPLARLLPRVSPAPLGLGPPWRRLLPAALLPALLTPLLLARLPFHFMPLLLGDYLLLHFALYGLSNAAALHWIGRSGEGGSAAMLMLMLRGCLRGPLLIAILAVAAYGCLALGVPTNAYVTSVAATPARWPMIGALLCGTLPYCITDEWLSRGAQAPHGAYAATKLCFLLSLALAICLNPERLFFLLIVAPVILLLFLIYGLISTWTYRRTGHPLVAASANAFVFAWAMAVTFPMLGDY